jgi:hypothetical protein
MLATMSGFASGGLLPVVGRPELGYRVFVSGREKARKGCEEEKG